MTLPHRRDGLNVLWMTVLCTFRRPFMGRPVPRQFMRNAWLDVTTIVPATAYHRRSYAKRYSRFRLLRAMDRLLTLPQRYRGTLVDRHLSTWETLASVWSGLCSAR